MKYCELDFKTILMAVKHRWKVIVASTACFAILGGAGGAIYTQRGDTQAQGNAQVLQEMDTTQDLTQQTAYSLFQAELELVYRNINSYYTALQSSEFLTEEEAQKITVQLEELTRLNTEQIQDARARMNRYGAIYVPTAFLSELITDYQAQLDSVESSLIAAKEATETVRAMGAPTYAEETITQNYSALLSTAANYGPLLQSQAKYQFYLERLTNERDEVMEQCQQLRTIQREAAESLNAQVTALNQLAQAHASENHVNFLVTYDADEVATITMNHTHGATTAQEDFLLIILFCTMIGLCAGGYYAVSMECGAYVIPRKKTHP